MGKVGVDCGLVVFAFPDLFLRLSNFLERVEGKFDSGICSVASMLLRVGIESVLFKRSFFCFLLKKNFSSTTVTQRLPGAMDLEGGNDWQRNTASQGPESNPRTQSFILGWVS